MKPAAPTPEDVAAVTQALARTDRRWIKGRELARLAGVPGRKIRLVAQHTGEIISGQQGYCLTERATWGELSQSRRDLESRARQMVERGQKQLRVYFDRVGAPTATTKDLPL